MIGALVVIVNCLVEVSELVAADTVKVVVVFEPTAAAVPVIIPVEELIESPEGSEPVVTEYVIVSPSGSVAVTEPMAFFFFFSSKVVELVIVGAISLRLVTVTVMSLVTVSVPSVRDRVIE